MTLRTFGEHASIFFLRIESEGVSRRFRVCYLFYTYDYIHVQSPKNTDSKETRFQGNNL